MDSGLIPAHAGKTVLVSSRALRARAHPRSRGENNKGGDGNGTSPGSSPLTRGKRSPASTHRSPPRLIPAHAGKTRRARQGSRSQGAHPRSRGENAWDRSSVISFSGSSPLTRGKLIRLSRRRRPRRLIPAHAGKTRMSKPRGRGMRAHPRSRGENRARRPLVVRVGGSSPLTRGKLAHRAQQVQAAGLIPAHAGKTGRSGCYGRT